MAGAFNAKRVADASAEQGRPMNERGQISVEFALVIPIILMVMVACVDGLVFATACARFDHIVPQRIIACVASPGRESYEGDERLQDLEQALEQDFVRADQNVSVEVEGSALGAKTYRCILRVAPWPLSSSGASVFGMRVPLVLEHECALALDPYTPGEL